MCGIVGINAKEEFYVKEAIKRLKRLEYRGYDSFGYYDGDKLKKKIGHIDVPKTEDKTKKIITHTRWATHGGVTDKNAHPHQSCNKKITVVHNGIINNYEELRQELKEKGHVFLSETDTEVIAHLIEQYSYKMTVSEAIRKTMSLLEGSYALAIIDTENPFRLYACKNKSPLLLGISDDGIIVASDVMACIGYSDRYVPLMDKTFVEIDGATYTIKDIIGKALPHEEKVIDVDAEIIENDEKIAEEIKGEIR
jgi:glucosamine--fructose-6-phosphate aminotransferase (isomerizing)